jgi:hypothetical protein
MSPKFGEGALKWVCHPSLDLFITPLHIPHHEPGSGERVIERGGMMRNFD